MATEPGNGEREKAISADFRPPRHGEDSLLARSILRRFEGMLLLEHESPGTLTPNVKEAFTKEFDALRGNIERVAGEGYGGAAHSQGATAVEMVKTFYERALATVKAMELDPLKPEHQRERTEAIAVARAAGYGPPLQGYSPAKW